MSNNPIFINNKVNEPIRYDGYMNKVQKIMKKSNIFYHPLNFIYDYYSPETIINYLTKLFSFKIIRNKKARKYFSILNEIIGASVIISNFYVNYKDYKKDNLTKDVTIKEKILEFIKSKLNIDVVDVIDINNECITEDTFYWLINSDIDEVKILNFYDKDFKEVKYENQQEIYINLKVKNDYYILFVNIEKNIMGSFLSNITLHNKKLTEEKINEFIYTINKEHIKSLDIENNIVYFDRCILKTHKRKSNNYGVEIFDVNPLLKEIEYALLNKFKRHYMFVGKYGTGKTTILNKIESQMKDYLFVKLSNKNFRSTEYITYIFNILKNIQPVVVRIDDMDSLGIKEKNEITGTILDSIDSLEGNSVVILSTINDSSLIDNSIVSRSGRSDILIEIKTPEKIKDVIDLIEYRIQYKNESLLNNLINNKKYIVDIKKIGNKCIKHKLTQADISNITDQMLIMNGINEFEYKNIIKLFNKSIKILLENRNTCKNFNLENK